MELILIGIVVIVVVAFIAYPLFTATHAEMEIPSSELDTLIAQRESAYDALRDLDFDFQLGKLSQSDYAALRDKYRARAAAALQQIDATGKTNGADVDADAKIEDQVARLRRAAPPEDAIEREVAKLRAKRKPADAIEDEVARMRAARKSAVAAENQVAPASVVTSSNQDAFCAKCGTPRRVGDQFCAKCGNKF